MNQYQYQYKLKYLKYKQKYLRLSDQIGSGQLRIVKLDSTLIEDEVDDDVIVQLNDLQTPNYIIPVSLKSKDYMIEKKDSGFYSIDGENMNSEINYIFESNIPLLRDNVPITIVDSNYNIPIDINKNGFVVNTIFITYETYIKIIESTNILFFINYKLNERDSKINRCGIIRDQSIDNLFKIVDANFNESDNFTFNLDSYNLDSYKMSRPSTPTGTSLVSLDWEHYGTHNIDVLKGTFSQYNAGILDHFGRDAVHGSCTIIALVAISIINEILKTDYELNIKNTDIDIITRTGIEKYIDWAKERQLTRLPLNATFLEGFKMLGYDFKYTTFEHSILNKDTFLNNVVKTSNDLRLLFIDILNDSRIQETPYTYIPIILIKSNITIAVFVPINDMLPYYIFNSHSDTIFLKINISHLIKCRSIDIFVNTILKIIPVVDDYDELNQCELNILLPIN
jgi:hypothetical protein